MAAPVELPGESQACAPTGRAAAAAVHSEDPAWVLGGSAGGAANQEQAAEQSAFERLKRSIWFPVLGKGLGFGFVLCVLALIGSWSTLRAKGYGAETLGLGSADAERSLAGLGAHWVQPTPSVEPAHSLRPLPAQVSKQRGGASRDAADAKRKHALSHPHPPEKSAGITEDGKIILNLATADELTRLPGVGKKRAETIIKLRERLKRFRKVTDLLRVRGIGVRTLKRLKPLLVLDPPPPEPPAEGSAEEKPRDGAKQSPPKQGKAKQEPPKQD